MTRFPWSGGVVLVTGASAGIGAAVARELATAGASVVLGARRRDRLERLRLELPRPSDHLAATVDVRDPASVRSLYEAIDGRYGRLDALVANAGIGVFQDVEQTSDADLDEIVATNLSGVIRCVRDAVPRLRRSPAGRIVLVSSSAGRRGFPGLGAYSATKWALYGLADALRVELRADGIRTTVVAPTATRTEFFDVAKGVRHEVPARATSSTPVARAIRRAIDRGMPAIDLRKGGRFTAALGLLVPSLYDHYIGRAAR